RRTQIEQLYAVAAVAGNHVTQDIDGTSLREHSIPGIADGVAPGGVGADDVEADVGLTPTLHGDAIPQVAGDEIAEKLQRGNRGADPDVLRTAFHEDAKTVIAGRVIVGIETDGVAGQHHHFARANVHAAARGNAVAAHAVHVELHAAGLVEEDAVQ